MYEGVVDVKSKCQEGRKMLSGDDDQVSDWCDYLQDLSNYSVL